MRSVDSAAVSIFVVILVELFILYIIIYISTNIETVVLSSGLGMCEMGWVN